MNDGEQFVHVDGSDVGKIYDIVSFTSSTTPVTVEDREVVALKAPGMIGVGEKRMDAV
jgi:hypothetical protein